MCFAEKKLSLLKTYLLDLLLIIGKKLEPNRILVHYRKPHQSQTPTSYIELQSEVLRIIWLSNDVIFSIEIKNLGHAVNLQNNS